MKKVTGTFSKKKSKNTCNPNKSFSQIFKREKIKYKISLLDPRNDMENFCIDRVFENVSDQMDKYSNLVDRHIRLLEFFSKNAEKTENSEFMEEVKKLLFM